MDRGERPRAVPRLGCRGAYLETEDIADVVLHFSPGLADDERAELGREFSSSSDATGA